MKRSLNKNAAHLFANLQCTFAQWFGFLVLASFAIQHGQVVQCGSNLYTHKRKTTHKVDAIQKQY